MLDLNPGGEPLAAVQRYDALNTSQGTALTANHRPPCPSGAAAEGAGGVVSIVDTDRIWCKSHMASGRPTHDGYSLGTLCVLDLQLRQFTEEEVATLSDLAALIIDELELRLSAPRSVSLEAELRQSAEEIASTCRRAFEGRTTFRRSPA